MSEKVPPTSIGTATRADHGVLSPHERNRSLGFWSAVATTVLAATAFAVGITTPVRSGPSCTRSCLTYPYTDAAAFVPRDYLWLYPALLLALAFVALISYIHSVAREDRKVISQMALSFALLSAAALTMDYFIQLAVVQPSLLKGEVQGLAVLTEANPHGVFIALEDIGYLMMSVAFLFTGIVLHRGVRLERVIGWLMIVGSVATIGALLVLVLIFGSNLDYRFEVVAIAINWTVLIVAGTLLSILFRKKGHPDPAVR